jgi:hypothetical protein
MVRWVCANRERQAVAIHNRHDFHASSALGRSDRRAPALSHHEGCIDEALFFVERAPFAKLVGDIPSESDAGPRCDTSSEAAMFVVRVALRQHVPLRAMLRIQTTASRT